MNKKVLLPLPSQDFDPSEAGIPWNFLVKNSVQIVFATPTRVPARCDQRMLNGNGLGILKPLLQADKLGQASYQHMSRSEEFKHPLKWSDVEVQDYDGVLLVGGHAKGMREFLESNILQNAVAEFDYLKKPIGAICHGTVLAARSKRKDGLSILNGKKTTGLLKFQELTAWALTTLWLNDYYRTYPETVETEVRSLLKSNKDFIHGPLPFFRDNPDNLSRGFSLVHENYISARWPGDAHNFANGFLQLLNK